MCYSAGSQKGAQLVSGPQLLTVLTEKDPKHMGRLPNVPRAKEDGKVLGLLDSTEPYT